MSPNAMTPTPHRSSPWLLTAALLALLGACSSAPPKPAAAADGHPPSDEAQQQDHQRYATQQAAIQALNDSGRHPVRSYALSKAQCWLDVSFHEFTRNDRSAFPREAFEESRRITEHLNGRLAGPDPAASTPLVNKAPRLRDDLWLQAVRLKAHAGFSCAAQRLACGEVELVHAGNEHAQQGWRHAKPYVQIAEDQLAEAELQAAACVVAPAPPPPAPAALARPVAPPVAAPAPKPEPVPTVERITLSAGALFRFNQRGVDDMLPAGRQQLDDLAQRLNQAYSRVDRIRLVGHTDRLGRPAYNERLSLDRAAAVRKHLQARGVTAPIEIAGVGASQPLVPCEGRKTATVLQACLQENRRVSVEVTGIAK